MRALILASALVFATSQSFADTEFDRMIKILGQTRTVADCQLTLAADESKSFELNVTQNSKTTGFLLSSPDSSGGRIVVKFDREAKTYHYAQSDIVGWVNLYVTLGADDSVIALKMTKTLPSGQVYDTGADCH